MTYELGSISSSKQRDAPVLYLHLMDVCILVVMCHSFTRCYYWWELVKGTRGHYYFLKLLANLQLRYLKFLKMFRLGGFRWFLCEGYGVDIVNPLTWFSSVPDFSRGLIIVLVSSIPMSSRDFLVVPLYVFGSPVPGS